MCLHKKEHASIPRDLGSQCLCRQGGIWLPRLTGVPGGQGGILACEYQVQDQNLVLLGTGQGLLELDSTRRTLGMGISLHS